MVATANELIDIVASFVADLEPAIRVERVILFGSYGSGAASRWSDIDIAVVSPDFTGVPMWRRQEMMAERMARSDPRLAPIGYSPEELAEPPLFLRQVLATGKILYPHAETS